MLIQCKIKRPGGSRVTMGDERYHFAPDDLGRHVAEVTNEAHIERLLAIPAYVALGDHPVSEAPPVASSATLSPGDDEPKPAEDVELEAAQEAYRERFGKNPHPRAKAETLWQRIEEGEA